jgi:hypothetical protein
MDGIRFGRQANSGWLFSWRCSLCRCAITSKWNVEGGRLHVDVDGFLVFLLAIEGSLD